MDMNSTELTATFSSMVWIFLYVFVLCELGQRITNRFEQLDDSFGQCNWYLFPIEMKKMFVITTAISQQPIFIRGYGNVFCSCETLKRVSLILNFLLGLFKLKHECRLLIEFYPNQFKLHPL